MPEYNGNQKMGRLAWIGIGVLVVGEVLSAAFLPHFLQNLALGALVVVFSVFFVVDRSPMPPLNPGENGRGVTIRQQFARTRTLFIRVTVPAVAAWCVFVTFYLTQLSRLEGYAAAAGGAIVLMVPAMLFIRKRFRCPRCGTNFKQARTAEVGRISFDTRGAEQMWDKCPNCGVSFDEPYRP
jgi:ribosomal protein S27AE